MCREIDRERFFDCWARAFDTRLGLSGEYASAPVGVRKQAAARLVRNASRRGGGD